VTIRGITLHQHLWKQRHQHQMDAELTMLLMQMGFVAKILSSEISRAALVGQLGLVGEKNATGDAQKKLDVFSNEVVLDVFAKTGLVAAIVSEELDQVKYLNCGSEAQYILCIDPLDGSSNTDTGGAVGTIFGFYNRITETHCGTEQDVLRPGSELVAAGYVLYGTSTILVYSSGYDVNGFTLDPHLGEFLFSHPAIRIPEQGHTYSANLGHYRDWSPSIQQFIQQISLSSDHSYALRYAGALVADFHRSLLEGGIYLYPPDASHEDGKLRLLYECAPLAFIAEQAGGRASTGHNRILEIVPQAIHQRVPLAIGSTADVRLYEQWQAMKG
jgi:fructose-1,6-bisphosphatase I